MIDQGPFLGAGQRGLGLGEFRASRRAAGRGKRRGQVIEQDWCFPHLWMRHRSDGSSCWMEWRW
jgi:hypothetical protein